MFGVGVDVGAVQEGDAWDLDGCVGKRWERAGEMKLLKLKVNKFVGDVG